MLYFFIKEAFQIIVFIILIEIISKLLWYILNSDSSFEILTIKEIKKPLYYLFFKYFPIIFIINLVLYFKFGDSIFKWL
jgi:hypothetical protein